MKPMSLLAAALITTSLVAPVAFAAESDSTNRNAALTYWKAIALFPSLSNDEYQSFVKASDTPLNDRLRRFVSEGEVALQLMREATVLDECDWGHDLGKGFYLLLPHLGKSRDLARMAILRMRIRLADGDVDQALEDFVATMKMSHHMGRDELMISMLVEYALRRMAVETAATGLAAMTSEQRAELSRVLRELPPPSPISESIKMEKALTMDYLLDAAKSGELYELLEKNVGAADRISEEDRADVRERLNDVGVVKRMLERLDSDYDRIEREMALPAQDSIDGLVALDAELLERVNRVREDPQGNSIDILTSMVLPASPSAKRAELQIVIREAMLQAAIAHANEGAEASGKVVDPVSGEPFQIKAIEGQSGWIELVSKIQGRGGKPISMKARVR